MNREGFIPIFIILIVLGITVIASAVYYFASRKPTPILNNAASLSADVKVRHIPGMA